MTYFGPHNFCRIKYTKADKPCLAVDSWDTVIILPKSKYIKYGAQSFTFNRIKEAQALLSLLRQAYEMGREMQRESDDEELEGYSLDAWFTESQ